MYEVKSVEDIENISCEIEEALKDLLHNFSIPTILAQQIALNFITSEINNSLSISMMDRRFDSNAIQYSSKICVELSGLHIERSVKNKDFIAKLPLPSED